MTIRPLFWASIAIFLLSLISFDPKVLVEGDARFIDVRTKLDKDYSGRKGDPREKYFRKLPRPDGGSWMLTCQSD
jgi:hypothetical protein